MTEERNTKTVRLFPYRNLAGNSGVVKYGFTDLTDDIEAMIVEFTDGSRYAYVASVVGRRCYEEMKSLAQAGRGLATYISREHPAGLRLGGGGYDDHTIIG